mgnify:CR=1 FL=1
MTEQDGALKKLDQELEALKKQSAQLEDAVSSRGWWNHMLALLNSKLLEAKAPDEAHRSRAAQVIASALDAIRRASPFPPIPESLKDLANEPMIIRFEVAIRVRS